MATTKFNYGEDTLTYNLAFEIAEGKIAAGLSESQKKIISLSRKNVENALEADKKIYGINTGFGACLLYTSPSPRDAHESRMPSSA